MPGGFKCILLSAAIFLASCKTSRIDLQNPENNGDLLLALERTPCFGVCPVYEAKLYSNGLLLYHGKRNTDKTGMYYAKVSKKELSSLSAFMLSNNYFELESKYPVKGKAPSDLPSCIIYFKNKNSEKRIEDHRWETPESLSAIERKVDSLIASQQFLPLDTISGR